MEWKLNVHPRRKIIPEVILLKAGESLLIMLCTRYANIYSFITVAVIAVPISSQKD